MKLSSGRPIFRSLIILTLMLVLSLIPASASAAGPTLLTDLSDYEPGDTVTFRGSGFSWGEVVNLQAVGSTNGSQIKSQATADIFGNISGSFVLPLVYESTYSLSASNSTNGLFATTSFGDKVPDFRIVTPTSPASLAPSQTQTYEVQTKGSKGNISGVPVKWTATGGTLSTDCSTTAGNDGKAATTYTAGTVAGTYQVTADEYSGAGCTGTPTGATDSQNVTIIVPDSTPPVISYVLTPSSPDGTNGWYKSNVTLVWSVTDPESAVSKTGCVDQNITADQAANAYTCSASSAGGSSGPVSVTVKRDATPPTNVTGVAARAPDHNGWYTSPVVVTFSGQDATSGISSCTSTTYSGPDNAATSVAGNCTDNAGNVSSGSFILKYDGTGPSASLSVTGGTLGAHNWYTTDVTVHTSGDDSVSGIELCTLDQFQSTESAGTVFNGSCTNGAGLATNASPLTIKLDKTGPTATLSAVGTLGSNDWYVSNVTVKTTGSDTISNPTTCTLDQSQTTDTAATTFNSSCTNDAGLTTNAATLTIKRDATPPTLALTFTPDSPDGMNGWWKTSGGVPFAWTCTDATSGIDSSFGGGCPSPLLGTTTAQGTTNFIAQVRDMAGNLSVPINRGLKLDNVAPTGVSAAADRAPDSNGWYNHAFTATWNGTDATSGIANCTKTTYSGPDTDNGSLSGTCTDVAGNMSNSVAFAFKYDATKPTITINGAVDGMVCSKPTPSFTTADNLSGIATSNGVLASPSTASGVGKYTYTATATDVAGNTATASNSYYVTYGSAFGGYLQPINMDGSSRFKLGSTVPVKFQLMCGTTPIANATAWLYVAQGDSVADPGVDEAISTAASTTGNLFRYDSTAQQYIFNLSTKLGYTNPDGTTISAFSQGTWTLKIKLDDGTWRSVNIQLPK